MVTARADHHTSPEVADWTVSYAQRRARETPRSEISLRGVSPTWEPRAAPGSSAPAARRTGHRSAATVEGTTLAPRWWQREVSFAPVARGQAPRGPWGCRGRNRRNATQTDR